MFYHLNLEHTFASPVSNEGKREREATNLTVKGLRVDNKINRRE